MATLLLCSLALYWLAIWLLPPRDPRKSPLGLAYDRIDSTMTLPMIQSIVGRAPDNSVVASGPTSMLDQQTQFSPLNEESGRSASWRDDDERLIVYYNRRDQHVLVKQFYCCPADFPNDNSWQRLVDWFHRIFK
jgi:hypothetical protein